MTFFDIENISDEALAAYIDGNATPEETTMISDAIGSDPLLMETLDMANESIAFSDGLTDFMADVIPVAEITLDPSNDNILGILDPFDIPADFPAVAAAEPSIDPLDPDPLSPGIDNPDIGQDPLSGIGYLDNNDIATDDLTDMPSDIF